MRNLPLDRFGLCLLTAILALAIFPVPTATAPLPQQDDPQAQARALFDAGTRHFFSGDYGAALQAFEKALPLYQAAADPIGEASTLQSIGMANHALGNWEAALDAFARSLPLWTELGQTEFVVSAHNAMAYIYDLRLDNLEQAHSHYTAVLEVSKAANLLDQQAMALWDLGTIELRQKQPALALARFEAASALWQELNQPDDVAVARSSMAQALTDIATEDLSKGRYDQALSSYTRALDIYRDLSDQTQEAWTLNQIGIVYQAQARYQEAQQSHNAALELCQEIPNRQCEAATLNNLGEVYHSLGRYQDALTQYEAALVVCHALDDCAQTESYILHNVGRNYIPLGQYEEALNQLNAALDLARELPDQEQEAMIQEANILNSIATVYEKQAKYEEALSLYQEALTIFQDINHPEGEEATRNNIGIVYGDQGRFNDALNQYQTSLDLAREIIDPVGEATSLGNMGSVYAGLGRYEEALRQYQAALDIWEKIGALDGQGTAHNGIGAVYDDLGQYERAEAHYSAALRVRQQTGDQAGEGTALNNLGVLYHKLERYEEALNQYESARDIALAIGDPALQATVLDNIGAAQADLNRHEEALASHMAALNIRTGIGDRAGEGASQSNIAALYAEQEQYEQALTHYAVALEIFRETGQTAHQAQILSNIGRMHHKQGDLAEAITLYQQAVEVAETVQEDIKVEELASAFAGGQATLYSRLVDTLVSTGDSTAAFDYAERARARVFLGQIGNQGVDFRLGARSSLTDQEQKLRQEIIGLQNALGDERAKPFEQQSPSLLDELTQDLEGARRDYDALITRLKLESPEYASLVSVDALSLDEVQSQVLDEHTTLVEYFVLDEQALAWVVDREGFELVSLEVTRDDLRAQVEFLRQLIARRDFDASTAGQLYATLFAPLKPHLRHANLVIVPHGVLHYLPFAALWEAENKHYLAQDYALTYAPSASVLQFILDKRNADEGRLLALGNPDGSLPRAKTETEIIAELFGATPLLGGQAVESQVHAQAGQLDVLHLAAHGVYNPFNPLFTRIELAPDGTHDGNLEVHEVFGLDLTGTNLVVLSACETALGEQSEGDELVGLTRAFLYAGTPSVVTTLWSIDDAASGFLMEAFYRHLRDGLTNAEALRAAQLEVLAEYGWQTPYYWAAFSLTGHYRGSGEPRMVMEETLEPTVTAAADETPTSTPVVETPTPEGDGGRLCGGALLPLSVAMLASVSHRRLRRKS
jgi:tetratricopeptide (TPR) repeat protein